MQEAYSFGYWVLRRRKALDLTREELAIRVGCASETIKKIERDERRPSRQIAELLANALAVPAEEQTLFLQVARGERSIDRMHLAAQPLRAFPEQIHNLPTQLTAFFGREDELSTIDQLLANPECRLLTLVGQGGVGKTRVALRAAERQLASYRQGVYFIPLAGVESGDALPSVIMDVLGLKLDGPVRSELVHYFRAVNRDLLFVLDNFEQLLEATDLIIEVLQNTQHVKFLVTSRERLNVQPEWVLPLTGLPFPSIETTQDIEQYPAAQLFLQTARRARLDFTLDDAEKFFLARICELVEGMPLAIELAASWTRILSCQDIAREIERGIAILATSMRDVQERHRNIRSVFDHSWELLSEEERCVLKQLSIFRGGFTRETSEKVAGASLTNLSALVDKSLLERVPTQSEPQRYDLHQLIRQYAYERLLEVGEIQVQQTRDRHLETFLNLAEDAEPELRGPDSLLWLERLERDYDNLRTAFAWATEPTKRSTGEQSQRLLRALCWFLGMRGHGEEGCQWAKRALAQDSSDDAVQAKATWVAGFLNLYYGDRSAARYLLERGVTLCRELGTSGKQDLALALTFLGVEADRREDHDLSQGYYEETLALQRELGDLWGIAQSLSKLAYSAEMRGDFWGARSFLEEGLSIALRVGERSQIASLLCNLGWQAISQADMMRAQSMFLGSLEICYEMRWLWMTAQVFKGLGIIEASQTEAKHLSRAARLWGISEMLLRTCGSVEQLEDSEPEIAVVREQLGKEAFSKIWENGHGMSLDQAIAFVLDRDART